MSLFNRIVGLNDEPKISPHLLMAVLNENIRGSMTNAQAVAAFNPPLTAAEVTEITAVKNAIIATTISRAILHDVLMLAEARYAPYNSEANVKSRLGF
jgi:hypothetical protein